ncbi:CmcJ/NvfI family oxidoreductase [Bradyrhizobium sp. Pha-3]|uniref:CmcJ/NvfI family oxidoreductase n=1 Tax=Bradyrhizobium sp. Pha-3 TaxID=208375 RepID=UPI0035D40FA4
MIPFIKNHFNASWIVARRQSIIFRSAGGNSVRTVKEPIVCAHIDWAPIAGPVVAAMVSQSQGIPIRSYSRLMIIQAWHALSPPPQDFPLAICDGDSVPDTDIDVVDYTVLGNTIKLGIVHFNPAQDWYYFPKMTADELILFKSYDSEVRRNPMTAHSAFDNRRAHPNAKPRESLEARFFVYYA